MTEWAAIGWVVGGLVVILTLTNLLFGLKSKMDKKLIEQHDEERSLQENWRQTDKLKQAVLELKDIAEGTKETMKLLIEQRGRTLPIEMAKADAVRALLEDKAENPKFERLLQSLNDAQAAALTVDLSKGAHKP